MQNAADNAALSMATNQARTINILMEVNAMIARLCYEGEPIAVPNVEEKYGPIGLGSLYPFTPMGVSAGSYGQCYINADPMFPQGIGRYVTSLGDNASKITGTLDVIEGINLCYHGIVPYSDGLQIKTQTEIIRSTIRLLAGNEVQIAIARLGPFNSWKVARRVAQYQEINSKGEPSGADDAYPIYPLPNPMELYFKRNTLTLKFYAAAHYFFSIPPNPLLPSGLHGHYVSPELIGTETKSWYYADQDTFYKKKLILIARKSGDSPSNSGYPIFGKWFGIEWPEIETIAAASYYNKGGPGFVLKTSFNGERIKENIDAYWEAKKDKNGWYAHLVPVGQTPILH